MGGRYSALAQAKSTFEPDTIEDDSYFALALLEPNRICIVYASAEVIGIIRRSIRSDRSLSISSTSGQSDDFVSKELRKDDGSYEIHFKGHPFSKFATHSIAIKIKRLLCQLVSDLYSQNWDLCVASDLTTDNYHTTWFFRKVTSELDEARANASTSTRCRSKRQIISLSLSGSDGLTLINAPERLRKAFVDAVRLGYAYGVESEDIFDDDLEIKLNGGPWETSMFEEGIWARKLLLQIFRQFSKHQYVYYAVADTKGTADSIFFIHEPNENVQSKNAQNCPVNKEVVKGPDLKAPVSAPSTKNNTLTVAVVTERRKSSGCTGDEGSSKSNALSTDQTSASNNQLSINYQPRRTSWQEISATTNIAITTSTPHPFVYEHFFMISLNRSDSLRLIDAPKTIRDATRDILLSHWPYGLQREIKYDMAYEFRLNRSPWAASGADAVIVHHFLTILFERMMVEGWRLLATLDISRRRNDKSVFILKKDWPQKLITPLHHFCLNMTDGDKIRIIRADEDVIKVVQNVIKDHWPYGIQKQREFCGAYEIQLIGHPWLNLPGRCNEPLSARVMLLELLRQFYANHWRVIVSADVSARYQTPANLLYNTISVDSWIVVKEDSYQYKNDKTPEETVEAIYDSQEEIIDSSTKNIPEICINGHES